MRRILIAMATSAVFIYPAHAQMVQSPQGYVAQPSQPTAVPNTSLQPSSGLRQIPSNSPSSSANGLSGSGTNTNRDMPERPEGPLR
jgi:hypothetical protein